MCVDELTGNRLDFDRYPFFTMVLIFVTAITIVMGINSEDPRRYIIALVLYCGVFLLFLIWKCFDVYQNPKKYQPKQNQNYDHVLWFILTFVYFDMFIVWQISLSCSIVLIVKNILYLNQAINVSSNLVRYKVQQFLRRTWRTPHIFGVAIFLHFSRTKSDRST